ncbi:MAG: hypothetical protein PHE49_03400 [bacterium]|nr:hypothetical protein [bacterium]
MQKAQPEKLFPIEREYKISKDEINRRKRAFTTLSISLIIGLILASKILDFPVSVFGYLCFATALFLSSILLFKSFDYLSQIKIYLSNQIIERTNQKASESFLIANINNVKIKRTTRNTIREIYIWSRDGKSTFINALEDFEQFRTELINKIGKNIPIKEMREKIDFDHPLFYSILGLLISFVGVYLIKTIASLDYFKTKVILFVVSVYIFAVGVYFICTKPISKRYGNKKKFADYIFGFIMVCFSVYIFILGVKTENHPVG